MPQVLLMDRWQMWAGPSRHFLVFPVRHGTMVNYVGFVPTGEEMKESWSAPGDPEVLRRAFDGWDVVPVARAAAALLS